MRIKKSLLLGLLSISLGGTLAKAQETKAYFDQKITEEKKIGYVLDYPKDAKGKLPLIVFLHGSGERGDDLEKAKAHGPFNYKSLLGEPVALLAPQTPLNEWWDTQAVYHLIEDIATRYNIDRSRIYLTGLSMGGWGSWKLANEHPELFAALAPVCAPSDRWMQATIHQYKDLPIKIFHGGNDDIVSPMTSIDMYQKIKRINPNVELIIFPDDNHNSWDSTYSDPAFYRWLLSQRKPQIVSNSKK